MINNDASLFTAADLASLLGLPQWDKMEELNEGYFADIYLQTFNYLRKEEGLNREECDEKAREEEEKANESLFKNWINAVKLTAEVIYSEYELEVLEVQETVHGITFDCFQISPKKEWKDSLTKIVLLLEGFGFCYDSTEEMVTTSSSKDYQDAVLTHLTWLKNHHEVYGGRSTQSIYQSFFK